jgi:hypothetical protein
MMHESSLDQQQNVPANGANQTERGALQARRSPSLSIYWHKR